MLAPFSEPREDVLALVGRAADLAEEWLAGAGRRLMPRLTDFLRGYAPFEEFLERAAAAAPAAGRPGRRRRAPALKPGWPRPASSTPS